MLEKETSLLEKEVMKKQFSFILSDISGVFWRKKHLTSTSFAI